MSNIAASVKKPSQRFPPILQLLKSPPFLAIVVVHFGNNWANYSLMAGTAIFLANIHHFDLAAVSSLIKKGAEADGDFERIWVD